MKKIKIPFYAFLCEFICKSVIPNLLLALRLLFHRLLFPLSLLFPRLLFTLNPLFSRLLFALGFLLFVGTVVTFTPHKSHALLGIDGAMTTPYLIKILSQSVKQYEQMKVIYENAKEHKDMIESINMGLNEAMGLLESFPIEGGKILGDLKSFKGAMDEVERLYGQIPRGKEELLLRLHDETVAESIKMVSSINSYAHSQEQNSRRMAASAPHVGLKGAARTNLEGQAAILHILSQILKINGQMLKLQSESLALSNKAAKESNHHFKKVTRDLGHSLNTFEATFATPPVF